MDEKVNTDDQYLQIIRKRANNSSVLDADPCKKESIISMKCLDRNNYDKTKCELEFRNYKFCKSFWYYVAKDRQNKGLPVQMTEEERKQIKEEFVENIKTQATLLSEQREKRAKKKKSETS